MKKRTVGLSPKLVRAALVGIAVFAATKLAIDLDPILEQATNVVAILGMVYASPPGEVASEHVPEGGDVEV